MNAGIFDPEADQKRYERFIQAEAPSKTYSILFTPRSGSSWLTSILTETKAMGTPEEWFNPQLMPSSTRSKGARSLDQFIEAISRHRIHGGVFGFEITFHQLSAVFGSRSNFMSRFPDATFFWLIRRDIVSQGVSLDKMVQTNISHAPTVDASEIGSRDDHYSYDSGRIKKWIQHIRAAEIGTEKMISDYGLRPTRLSYEGMVSMGVEEVVNIFASQLGVNLPTLGDISSGHRKIATSKNDEFSKRFSAENQEFLKGINAARAEMLSQHN